MAQLQIFEGTVEELIDRKEEFTGMKLQVFAMPEEETKRDGDEEKNWNALLPDAPDTMRDSTHLESLLMEGINSPKEPVTDQEWLDIRAEVH